MEICLLHASARPTPVYGEIAKQLRSSGHDVWTITLDSDGTVLWDNGRDQPMKQPAPPAYPPRLPKSRLFSVAWARFRELVLIRRFRRQLRELRPDIVQINASGMKLTSLIPPRMPKETAFILDFRQIGDQRRSDTLWHRLRNQVRTFTRRTSTIASFDHSSYLHPAGANKGLGPDWERWGSVVPMGVDDLFLSVAQPASAEQADAPLVRFIYCGSMVRHRKLEVLFAAIRSAADVSGAFEFHFLGRDASDGYYESLIAQLDLTRHVKLIPPVPYEKVPEYLVEFDVAVAYVPYEPTDWTYHPTLKVIEYRAAGLPIIATDVAPNHEYVQTGYNGFLCPNTADDFSQAMLRLIEDRQLLAQTKRNAINGREGMTWVEVSQLYEALYHKVLAGRQAQRTSSEG